MAATIRRIGSSRLLSGTLMPVPTSTTCCDPPSWISILLPSATFSSLIITHIGNLAHSFYNHSIPTQFIKIKYGEEKPIKLTHLLIGNHQYEIQYHIHLSYAGDQNPKFDIMKTQALDVLKVVFAFSIQE